MANTELEDLIVYLETTKLATISDFDRIVYTDFGKTPPRVKTYGAHIYLTPNEFYESERQHIGNHLTDFWKINVDIILNRHFQTMRKSISDAKGISYWKKTITTLLLDGSNSGIFESSKWEFQDLKTENDNYTLEGVFNCEVVNTY